MNTNLKELTKYTDFHHKMCEENKHRTVYKIEVTRDNNKTALTVDPKIAKYIGLENEVNNYNVSCQITDKPTFLVRGGFKFCKNKKKREESRCNLLHILDGGSKQALLGNFCKAAQTAIAKPMQFF